MIFEKIKIIIKERSNTGLSTWFGGTRLHSIVDREKLAAEQVSESGGYVTVQQLVAGEVLPTGDLLIQT